MTGEEEFLRKSYPLIYSIANNLTIGYRNADDLAQFGAIAVLQLYRKSGGRPDKKLVYTAARREMIDRIRMENHRRQPVETFSINEAIEESLASGSPEDEIISAIDQSRLRQYLESFISLATPRQQCVLRRIADGLTLKAISLEQGVTEGYIAQIKQKGIARIRELLDEQWIGKRELGKAA